VMGYQASIYAHEMGHNFGMEHDAMKGYLMAPSDSESTYATKFSTDSVRYMENFLENSYARLKVKCLEDSPTAPTGPVCGNGITEEGEDCDPGMTADTCCTNCRLAPGCQCAHSQVCCDAQGKFAPSSTVCRHQVHPVCDIVEMCTGSSGVCPADTVAKVGTPCQDDGIPGVSPTAKSYCYAGFCVPSRTMQCRTYNSNQEKNSVGCDQGEDCLQLECGKSKATPCNFVWQLPPLDGTPCGGGSAPSTKFCVNGQCRKKSDLDPSTSPVCVRASSLNVRTGSGVSYPVAWQAKTGDVFEVVGKSADSWWQVRARNGAKCGSTGWAKGDYLDACNKSFQC